MKKQILISGAGFAGLTLAYWLNQLDPDQYAITVVELSPNLRTGGSPIDVRGEALTLVKSMGLYEKIKAKEFIHDTEIVDADDNTLVSFSINQFDEYTGDIEINRSELMEILYQCLDKQQINILFNTSVQSITERPHHVEVIFENGVKKNYDLLFGADGTHSITRSLVFGAEKDFSKFYGAYFAFASANNLPTQRAKDTGIIYKEVGKQAMLYQFKNQVNAVLMFSSSQLAWDHKDFQGQKKILQANFQGKQHWKIPEILNSMLAAEDLYFDELCQIHMPSWTKGRVALVGDAAYAPSFLTGMGTSIAMLGAKHIAEALHKNQGDHKSAFKEYEQGFRPFVASIQDRITRGLKVQLPTTTEALKASLDFIKQSAKQ